MTIFIIVKIWNGGKIDLIGAYKTEENARFEASKNISIGLNNFTIAIYTVKLMDF